MKRIFIVALCVALCVCAIAVPASASTYEERWTNVLDYATVNNTGSNAFGVTSGSAIPFALPGATIVQDIDIVFRSNRDITSVKVVRDEDDQQFSLKIVRIGSNLYRAFGQLGGYSFDTLNIVLSFNSGTVAYGEILQLHISSQTVDFYNLGATIDKTPGVDGPSSHSSGSFDTVFSFYDTGEWNIMFNVVDWKKVDYLYFGFSTQNVNLGRICAYVGDRSLSVNVESFDSDPDGTYSNFISGYIDLYGVDRDGANNLQIVLSGTSNSSGNVWLSWLNGSIKVDSPSIFGLIWRDTVFWLGSIYTKLNTGFHSVIDAIAGSFDGLKQEQGVTNDKIDGITDYQPTPSTTPNEDVMNDMTTKEEALQGSVSTGNAEANTAIGNAVDVVLSRTASFACVAWLMGLFFQVEFFTDLLYLSLGISVLVLLFGLSLSKGKDVTDAQKKSTSLTVVDKE